MSSSGIKRQRSTNFSISETECLVDEVLKRAAVIENKQTDAVTWKQKENAWRDLRETFNTLTAGNRTEKMLKVKYDGIKRGIKQKHNRAKSEQFMTGGGVAEVVSYTPWEEKLLRLISLSVEGLHSENDCDSGTCLVDQSQILSQANVEVIHVLEEIPAVTDLRSNSDEEYTNVDQSEVVANCKHEMIDTLMATSSSSGNVSQPNMEKTNKVSNWDTWTPTALRNRPNKKLKVSTQRHTVEDKYKNMANSREDLINIQKKIAEQELSKLALEIEFLRKEDARKEEQHQLMLEILNLQKQQLLKK